MLQWLAKLGLHGICGLDWVRTANKHRNHEIQAGRMTNTTAILGSLEERI